MVAVPAIAYLRNQSVQSESEFQDLLAAETSAVTHFVSEVASWDEELPAISLERFTPREADEFTVVESIPEGATSQGLGEPADGTIPDDVSPSATPPKVEPALDELTSREVTPPMVRRDELDLQLELDAHAIEISIDTVKETRQDLIRRVYKDCRVASTGERLPGETYFFESIAQRAAFAGLPFRAGADRIKDRNSIWLMNDISSTLRRLDNGPIFARTPEPSGFDSGPEFEMKFEMACISTLESTPKWHRSGAVPTLGQMLQTGSYMIRLALVETLAEIPGREACLALAERAVFDLSPVVREAAIEALKDRPLQDEARQTLLRGLRYPWAPIADQASAATAALRPSELISELEVLLEQPDPTAPFMDAQGQWHKTELVRVNHLRNCVLCHAVSASRQDPVRGVIPVPGEPLPQKYYQSSLGDFVRADVTYLRQDFSVMHQVANAAPWPERQRFDYFVRTRPLTSAERDELSTQLAQADAKAEPRSDPQRDAILRAIRALREPH